MDLKVSIIIPIYNVEEYLEECLVSAINQSLKEIEIICVNDGTLDHSMDIVNKYAETDRRIVIVEKENGGLSSARNAGMDVAKGEYIYFLDSDDYLVENAMEFLYHQASQNRLDDIFFSAQSFFESEEVKEKNKFYIDYYTRAQEYKDVFEGKALFSLMEENSDFRPSACLQFIRRAFLQENEIKFYEGILHEDNPFTMQCITMAKRVMCVPNKLYMRRVRAESIMTGVKGFRSSYGYYKGMEEYLNYMETRNVPEEFIQTLKKRLCNMYNNAVDPMMKFSDDEIADCLVNFPALEQVKYHVFVKSIAERRKNDRERCARLESERNELARRVEELTNSNSYKIGHRLMYVPGKVKRFILSIKDHGLKYTFQGVKRKIFNKLPKGVRRCWNTAKCRGKGYYLWSLKNKIIKKKTIFVSIIMPVYNAGEFLRECMESVVEQSLKNNIEVICVNDGSTDNSMEILQEFASQNPFIRIIDKENTGAGDCRNVGLKEAKGEYVLFLDADDIFDSDLCKASYYRAKHDKADICFFGARRLNMQLQKIEPMRWVLRRDLLPNKRPFKKENIESTFFQITSGCPWSKLFRREYILENQLEFQNLKNANDLYFVRMAMSMAGKMTYLKESLVTYRFASGNNTQFVKQRAPLEFYKAYKALKDKMEEKGVYKFVEQSFVNIALEDCMFNLRTTITEEAKEMILHTLKEEGFEYFGFDKYSEDYFYNQTAFKEYVEAKEK